MTNFLNDLEYQPVVISAPDAVHPWLNAIPIVDGYQSGLTCGMFVGQNTAGNMVLADASAAVFIPAMGALIKNMQKTTTFNGQAFAKNDACGDAYNDNITFQAPGIVLTPGDPIYLSSGGGITQNYPDNTGDIRQQLGFAIGTDKFTVHVLGAYTIGRNP